MKINIYSYNCLTDRYHEDVELDKTNDKYNFWYKHGLAMLNIHEVEMDDVGQYSCVATNRLGACTTVGELNIQGFYLLIYTFTLNMLDNIHELQQTSEIILG